MRYKKFKDLLIVSIIFLLCLYLYKDIIFFKNRIFSFVESDIFCHNFSFDYLTFGVLLCLFHANQELFQTGWFVESVLSAALVVFVVRTRLPFIKSLPSRTMMLVTGAVGLVTLLIPYSPLAGVLGFSPLPLRFLLAVFGIVALYLGSAELVKRLFYHLSER